jgi:hypothetical protein
MHTLISPNQSQYKSGGNNMIQYLISKSKESRVTDSSQQRCNLEEINGELLVYGQKF